MVVSNKSQAAEVSLNQGWRVVVNDLEQLRTDIARLGEKSVAESQEVLTAELDRVKAAASDLLARANTESQIKRDELVDLIQTNPVTSVGAAFAAGLLFAALLVRRRR